jgi:deoxyribodipyrimidine photolyase
MEISKMSTVAASQDASDDFRMKRWCLELSMLPTTVRHRPWEVPTQVLQAAGMVLGEAYPARIISDLKAERKKSVEAVLKVAFGGYDMITLPDGKQTVAFTKKELRIDQQCN